jgi:hypothetical protein
MKSPEEIIDFLRKDHHWAYAVIIAMVLTNVAYDYYFVTKETAPQSWDQSRHLISSLSYYYILTSDLGFSDKISRMLQVDNYYPPFYHFSTVLMYFLFRDTHPSTAIMINTIYLGILVFSAHGIGKKLFNREVGLLTAFLVLMYPPVFDRQHEYMIELALMAFVSLSIYLLLCTDHFKNRMFSLAFGIVFGLSVLTKWTSIFFIIGPLIWVSYETFKPYINKKTKVCSYCGKIVEKPINNANKVFCSKQCKNAYNKSPKSNPGTISLINLIIAGAVSLIVALPWYSIHLSDVINTLSWGIEYWGTSEGDPEVLTLKSLTYYLFSLISYQASFVFFIIFLIGMIFLLKSSSIRVQKILLLLWILIPYVVMTSLRNKNTGYTDAIIVAVAVISALWISSISSKRTKISLLLVLFVFGSFQLIMPSIGYTKISDATRFDTSLGTLELYNRYGRPPINEEWNVEETLKDILNDARNNSRIQNRAVYMVVLPDTGQINGLTFSYYSYLNRFPFEIYNGAYIGKEIFAQNILNFDYVILKTGENGNFAYQKTVDELYELFSSHISSYGLMKETTLPDGSKLMVYRNNYLPRSGS